MYLTFEQAMQLIKADKPKNANYHKTRIRQLINEGFLTEVSPEIFVKNNNDFISLGHINTERLVTEESVNKYIQQRKDSIEQYGKIAKKNIQIKAVFSDETIGLHISIESASRFFNVSRTRINNSIKKNKAIQTDSGLVRFFII